MRFVFFQVTLIVVVVTLQPLYIPYTWTSELEIISRTFLPNAITQLLCSTGRSAYTEVP